MFLDTEASGLPKKWNVPYSEDSNWPHVVQVSWLIYTAEGKLVKQEDHYIGDQDFCSTPSALKIHGITEEYRGKNGEERSVVMSKLAADMIQYSPLLVGHFTELDIHMLGADFYRTGIENPVLPLPSFCTMVATTHYVRNPQVKYLRLGELFSTLFHRRLENQHNAFYDARATAECFFELVKRGDIDDEKIEKQQQVMDKVKQESRYLGYGIPVLIVFLLTILFVCLL